jgi:hypothetical protein
LPSAVARYLGGTGSAVTRLLAPGHEEIRLLIEPAKLYARDFAERMSE